MYQGMFVAANNNILAFSMVNNPSNLASNSALNLLLGSDLKPVDSSLLTAVQSTSSINIIEGA